MIVPGIANKISPLRQAIACFILAVIGMLFCRLFITDGSYAFMAAFCGVVLYSIINSVVSVFHETFVKYTWPSWGLFALLLVVLLFLAKLTSGISIWKLAEYRMMLSSITAFYIMTSLLVRLIRMIWEFAEEDEN